MASYDVTDCIWQALILGAGGGYEQTVSGGGVGAGAGAAVARRAAYEDLVTGVLSSSDYARKSACVEWALRLRSKI